MDADPTRPDPAVEPAADPQGERAAVRDRRPAPRGALPRHAQTWIMLGLAGLILGVILITGRPAPAPAVSFAPAAAPSGTVPPERVRSYQESLTEREARLRAAPEGMPIDPILAPEPAILAPAPLDPLVDERRRREVESLFADNVAFSRRSSTPPAVVTTSPMAIALAPSPSGASVVAPPPEPAPRATTEESRGGTGDEISTPGAAGSAAATVVSGGRIDGTSPGRQHTLLEGTVIESVLINRLDGTFQGPVQCLVTTPVYSHDRQTVVIPAGARVLGAAAPVQAWGDTRLAVRFHRLVLPDGRAYGLESLTGLNQIGETGLTDDVDCHYLQVFGASLAIGAISGLAQFGTRAGFDMTAADASRQAAGGSLATSTARVLDRYLNVLPTITIREGHRIKIVLTSDLHLPADPRTPAAGSPPPAAFAPPRPLTSGGSR